MSRGRNQPCPCGSGLKYKKCCINSTPNTTGRDTSPAAINERIAYAGSVGRERKEWCENYIAWKTDHLEMMVTDQRQAETSAGKHICCSKGCWFCCSQFVGASLQECDAIVYWLHLHQDVRELFLARYPAWRSSLRKNEPLFQRVLESVRVSMSDPLDEPAREALMEESKKYQQLDCLCPFLDDGTCSIYPVRPLVCASVVVVSSPEHCKPDSTEAPALLLGASASPKQPPYFRGSQDSILFSSLPMLVHEIINGGFIYLNDLPGLAGLETEAFDDPEIRALLT